MSTHFFGTSARNVNVHSELGLSSTFNYLQGSIMFCLMQASICELISESLSKIPMYGKALHNAVTAGTMAAATNATKQHVAAAGDRQVKGMSIPKYVKDTRT